MFHLRLLTATLVVGALTACTFDADDDGLTNKEEKDLGLDKDNADSDGDGVSDFDEVEGGTDPLEADSDGDGHWDRAEIEAGTDPLDASDMIYGGRWPVNNLKHEMGTAMDDLSGDAVSGQWLARVEGSDQFGNMVDLYDFLGHDKPVIVDISAAWCGPCQDMALWLEGYSETYAPYNNIRDAVDNEEVYWVTFISQNLQGGNAGPATVEAWYNNFPHEKVPVLVDRGQSFAGWADLQFFPTTMWINPDGTIQVYRADEPTFALERISTRLDEL